MSWEDLERSWNSYLRYCARTTGAMVELSLSCREGDAAASFTRVGVNAARLLGWYGEDVETPPEAFENARRED